VEKVKTDANAFVYPMPMVLAGAMVENKPNFMAVGWVARVNFQPPMIGISLGKTHYTNGGIHQNQAFSVNVPGMDLIEKIDYCGLVTGKTTDKSQIFDVFCGELKNAPMIRECPLCMECNLVQTVDMPSNTLFIGEILGAYTEDRYLTDGKPDILKINPFTLTMPDNRYWAVGRNVGKAWEIGKNWKTLQR
jgi:flavin reductase (DIM6/NTAB) family NADH-FMN oxidoreductase RutF